MRIGYRLRQGFRQLFGHLTADDWGMVQSVLDDPILDLFRRLAPGDQVHACCVLRWLQRTGPASPALMQAALLHDIGKAGSGLTLVNRTVIVLLRAASSSLLVRWSQDSTVRWRQPYIAHARHASFGAQLADQAGCSARVVWLIRHHDLRATPDAASMDDVELAALQAADDAC